jgi:hypothetical protein
MANRYRDCGHKKRELLAVALEAAVFAVVFCSTFVITLQLAGRYF